MLTVTDLSKSFGTETILESVGFTINDGERVGFTGRNGSGKTTLLRILTGEEGPDNGTISAPKGYSMRYLSQHIHFTERTVLKEACADMHVSDEGKDESYRVKAILQGLGFALSRFDFD